MPLDFSPYQAVLLDLDGTLYRDDQALPGAVELVKRLQAENRKFACLSNSAASPLRVMARLEEMGIDLDPNNIYTAAAAACDYVIQHFPARVGAQEANVGDQLVGVGADSSSIAVNGSFSGEDENRTSSMGGVATATLPQRKPRVFNLATESVDDMLYGLVDWVNAIDDGECDAIIVGPPSGVFATEQRQRTALELARRGAALVGICADRIYPSPRGVEFGSGALTWMLAYASGVEPIFCGKPETIFFHELCTRLAVEPEWCLLIGDNLESDVSGAKSVGMRTILTLSGVTRTRDVERTATELQPDLVIQDLSELV